jgi:hypothetical protein
VRKISAPPGFDPRTAQPVASRYTDYATRPTSARLTFLKMRFAGKEIKALEVNCFVVTQPLQEFEQSI